MLEVIKSDYNIDINTNVENILDESEMEKIYNEWWAKKWKQRTFARAKKLNHTTVSTRNLLGRPSAADGANRCADVPPEEPTDEYPTPGDTSGRDDMTDESSSSPEAEEPFDEGAVICSAAGLPIPRTPTTQL